MRQAVCVEVCMCVFARDGDDPPDYVRGRGGIIHIKCKEMTQRVFLCATLFGISNLKIPIAQH